MTHFKKHWWKYLLLALAVIYVITSLVKNEWNPIKWFANGTGRVSYDTARCCREGNPCGWSASTYSRACAS